MDVDEKKLARLFYSRNKSASYCIFNRIESVLVAQENEWKSEQLVCFPNQASICLAWVFILRDIMLYEQRNTIWRLKIHEKNCAVWIDPMTSYFDIYLYLCKRAATIDMHFACNINNFNNVIYIRFTCMMYISIFSQRCIAMCIMLQCQWQLGNSHRHMWAVMDTSHLFSRMCVSLSFRDAASSVHNTDKYTIYIIDYAARIHAHSTKNK